MSEAWQQRLEDHMNTDDKNFDRIATALEKILDMQEAMSELAQRLGTVETNVEWLSKWFWLLVTGLS